MENLGRCLASWMRVLAAQDLQRYGFPFFEHMVFGGKGKCFYSEVAFLHLRCGGGGRCWKC